MSHLEFVAMAGQQWVDGALSPLHGGATEHGLANPHGAGPASLVLIQRLLGCAVGGTLKCGAGRGAWGSVVLQFISVLRCAGT